MSTLKHDVFQIFNDQSNSGEDALFHDGLLKYAKFNGKFTETAEKLEGNFTGYIGPHFKVLYKR